MENRFRVPFRASKGSKEVPRAQTQDRVPAGPEIDVRSALWQRSGLKEWTDKFPGTASRYTVVPTSRNQQPSPASDSAFIEVIVQLPEGSVEHPKRTFKIPAQATVGQMIGPLSRMFKVDKDNWHLYGRREANDKPATLPLNTPLRDFDIQEKKDAKLYLYPDVV